jgi:hypothetical protein
VRAGVKALPKDNVHIGVDPGVLPDFAVFRDGDAPWCPELVVIPAGQFLMGSPPGEPARSDNEGPQHRVNIGYRFAIGRYAVTFAEYDHFCEVTGCEKPEDWGWGRGRQPVINVSSNYGKHTYAGASKGEYRQRTVRVGTLPANPWGLHEMHGNVSEWVETSGTRPTEGHRRTARRGPTEGHRRTNRCGPVVKEIPKAASIAAPPGTTSRGTSVRQAAIGLGPTSVASVSGFAFPGRFE